MHCQSWTCISTPKPKHMYFRTHTYVYIYIYIYIYVYLYIYIYIRVEKYLLASCSLYKSYHLHYLQYENYQTSPAHPRFIFKIKNIRSLNQNPHMKNAASSNKYHDQWMRTIPPTLFNLLYILNE
jgi:hypothetical protein